MRCLTSQINGALPLHEHLHLLEYRFVDWAYFAGHIRVLKKYEPERKRLNVVLLNCVIYANTIS